jgi:hypothetical protein
MSYLLLGFLIGYTVGCPLVYWLECRRWREMRERVAD